MGASGLTDAERATGRRSRALQRDGAPIAFVDARPRYPNVGVGGEEHRNRGNFGRGEPRVLASCRSESRVFGLRALPRREGTVDRPAAVVPAVVQASPNTHVVRPQWRRSTDGGFRLRVEEL